MISKVAIGLSIILLGCDTFYTIPINGQTGELNVNLACGTMKVKMLNWQGHHFDFYQTCDFNGPVTFYADSIKAYWKNQTLPLRFIGEDVSNRKQITIQGKTEFRTAFYIDQDVKKGDTITVVPRGYMYCGNHKVDLDTLTLITTVDLKAPMEGMFKKD